MHGLMMEKPLLISSLIQHAAEMHADREIVSRTVEGPIHRYTYAESHRRAKQLANALRALRISSGDRVATIAWNGFRHYEIYFATSGIGAICHTINPRLPAEQLAYIIGHAEDAFIFVDLNLLPLLEGIADRLASVRGIVVMTDTENMPSVSLPNTMCYEELIAGHSDQLEWPEFDERSASSLCYTSGTTGHPKGVLYSHRSTILHSFAISLPDSLSIGEADAILPVVPMFHVNAWGIPYAAAMTGAKLVFPGPALDGASLTELMQAEGVTMAAGVPTLWLGLLDNLQQSGTKLEKLVRVIIGGSAVPRAMIEAFEELGVEVRQAWGMTEMSPLGTSNVLKSKMTVFDREDRYGVQIKQGRPVYGVQMKIVDEQGETLPADGVSFGELKVRGPWICNGYFKQGASEAHDADGWFATGDVSTIDADGFMHITDRTKDLIKSGGEWISSIELENVASGHPDVMQAAAIAVAHKKWGERPLLLVVPRQGRSPDPADLRAYLADRIPKMWMPDDIILVETLPLGATGKILKTRLREQYQTHLTDRDAL